MGTTGEEGKEREHKTHLRARRGRVRWARVGLCGGWWGTTQRTQKSCLRPCGNVDDFVKGRTVSLSLSLCLGAVSLCLGAVSLLLCLT